MGNQDRVTRRCALLGATGLLAASGLETSVPLPLASPALAQVAKPKMATEIPPDITTPDRVASRLGTLNFFDGVPDKATCEKVYDNLDFMRGVEVHASTFKFFEEINQVVQEEPISAVDPEIAGQLAAIGIIKCKPFAPDERMKRILTEAAAVGNATARAIVFRARSDDFYFYPGKSNWRPIFVGGSYLFMQNGAALLDARINFFYQATGVSPAMAAAPVGSGSQYAAAMVDARGNPFDGGKTYQLHLPPNIPAKQFWSLILYDTQTRSVLQTDQRDAGLSSETGAVATNADGSVDIYFAPTRPRGKENWIQTVPGKSWFVYFRLYSPLEPWFDKSWRPGDIEGLA